METKTTHPETVCSFLAPEVDHIKDSFTDLSAVPIKVWLRGSEEMKIWVVSICCPLKQGHAHTTHPFSHRKSMRALSVHQLDACPLSCRLHTAEHAGPVIRRLFLPFRICLALAPEIPTSLGVVLALLGLDKPLVLARSQSLSQPFPKD